jgi:hypothetical protein
MTGNRAGNMGGAIYSHGHSSTGESILINCTFAGNLAPNGNALACDSYLQMYPSILVATNTILWDGGAEIWNNDGSTITITHSDINGGWAGTANIDADPCFADSGYWDPNGTPNDVNDDFWIDGDYHLKSQADRWDSTSHRWFPDDVTSPCVDAGDIHSPIGHEPFPNGGVINMGAYGGTAQASKSYFGEPVCETIVAGDIDGDCKVDWRDLSLMAFHWLTDNNP